MRIPCNDCLILPICKNNCQIKNKIGIAIGINILYLLNKCKDFKIWWSFGWTPEKSTEIKKIFGPGWII